MIEVRKKERARSSGMMDQSTMGSGSQTSAPAMASTLVPTAPNTSVSGMKI